MKNLWTATRDSLHHSPAIILATLCSVGIAFLWGSNIGALYPVIDMTLKGDSMQSRIEKSIDAGNERLRQIESRLALGEKLADVAILPTDPTEVTKSEIKKSLEKDRRVEKATIARLEWGLAWSNSLLPRDPFQTICFIMGLLIVSTLVKHMLMLANDLLIGHVSTSISRDIRMRVFDVAMHMDKQTFQSYGTSGLLAAITSAADGLAAGLMSLFGAAVREPLRVLSCLIMACFINWRLLLLSSILAPLLIVVVAYFNKKIRTIASSILRRNAGFHEVLLEALNNVFTVQSFTMEKEESERFGDCTTDMRRAGMKMIFYTGLSKPFTELVGVGMVAITVCAGSYLVVNQETHIFYLRLCNTPMSITDLLIFFGLLIGASDPLRKLSGVSIAIYSGSVSANFLYGIIRSKPILPQPESPVAIERRHGQLSLSNVCFHYNPSQPILRNINLDIPFGRAIAILGANGSGKSTLIQLLGRYYDPVEGSIEFDGVDIRRIATHDIRNRIACVSQSTELFNRTVFENIQYGCPNSSRDEVIAAAKLAHAHPFITESLSDGYETVIGQSGQRLSGGQRQRIALARAILRNPEILILDESTSQIDMASEIQIRETLESMKGKMTLIIITHREALIALADEVFQIQNGHMTSANQTDSAAA